MTGQRAITCSFVPLQHASRTHLYCRYQVTRFCRGIWHSIGWIFFTSFRNTFVVSIRWGAQHVEHVEPYVERPTPPSPPPSPAVALMLPVQREEEVVHEESLFPAPREADEAGNFQFGCFEIVLFPSECESWSFGDGKLTMNQKLGDFQDAFYWKFPPFKQKLMDFICTHICRSSWNKRFSPWKRQGLCASSKDQIYQMYSNVTQIKYNQW